MLPRRYLSPPGRGSSLAVGRTHKDVRLLERCKYTSRHRRMLEIVQTPRDDGFLKWVRAAEGARSPGDSQARAGPITRAGGVSNLLASIHLILLVQECFSQVLIQGPPSATSLWKPHLDRVRSLWRS